MISADVVRILAMVLGGLMIATTIAVVSAYAHLVRVTHRAGPRFLPLHVGTIAASFILLAGFGMLEMYTRLGQPLSWRALLLLVAFSLANIAQSSMFGVVRAQLHEVT